MATTPHSTLTDPNIHEPKGVAAASSGKVYVSNGSGSGAWTALITKYSITISPTAVSANSTSEQTFSCPGVALATDKALSVSKPTHQTGLGIVGWRIPADNQIAIAFMNNTGLSITPTASQVYTVHVHRA